MIDHLYNRLDHWLEFRITSILAASTLGHFDWRLFRTPWCSKQ